MHVMLRGARTHRHSGLVVFGTGMYSRQQQVLHGAADKPDASSSCRIESSAAGAYREQRACCRKVTVVERVAEAGGG